ncbi:N-acetyl-gamma-glutamyl-phosphate reductase [Propionibacterium sp. oral taxon 192 str. F0372]|uniref:N-acetyl-gamma-glutamyl-phosphate reductase n=1 Tax=Propionibacterium sp. oral taxon 192 TaxID=671222 RepID=UPI0003542DF1|nr:N-acetyl-gamma-glutamyl-phosphate reductase [Propionibacterium sp. oral taxon 192]EPH00212.1 N-acetyl-gamma-glutamyl-phosphate reductase [Propionibacterium sp. oral taxon 192 str. F0372]
MLYSMAIAGATGYVGGEILRLASTHPQLEIGALCAHSNAGHRLGEHLPSLPDLADRELVETTIDNLSGHDVVFLALPHGASAAVVAQLSPDVLVIDCGPDFRLTEKSDWDAFYGTDYPGWWPYGLPELPGQRHVLAATKRVAVPGCYPTAITLSLLPALVSGLIDGHDVTVAAASGTSGAGKAAKVNLLGSELFNSMSAYGVGGVHRHVPEILQNMRHLGADAPTVSFTPMLAPISRGIIAVVTAPLQEHDTDTVQQIYADVYADEPFCHVLPAGAWPVSKSVLGSNAFQVQVIADKQAGRMVAVGVIDNLTKGTAGGAIQSMNIALGLPETTGLNRSGVTP